MHESVRKFYEPKPETIRNTADNKPLDIDAIERFRRIESGAGYVCTRQDVSATIVSDE
jgi:hypothetical protein